MATFVLVAGMWDGGWVWEEVTPRLRAAGHTVYPLTLTGLGEQAHLIRPDVDLSTHIQDVLGVLTCEELRDVILVGHSYGGAVIAGVAERAADCIARLVYLDAWVPGDGRSLADLIGAEGMAGFRAAAEAEGEGWLIPTRPEINQSPSHRGRQAPHPLKTFTQPLRLDNPAAAALPRTYIACAVRPAGPVFRELAAMAEQARAAGWHYAELPTGHMAMRSMPEELTAVFLEAAAAHGAAVA